MGKLLKFCTSCLNSYTEKYFSKHKCRVLHSFALVKQPHRDRYIYECTVPECNWKGRRNQAIEHRIHCKSAQIVPQDANSCLQMPSANADGERFKQFKTGIELLTLEAKLNIIGMGILLRFSKKSDPYGNWICNKLKVQVRRIRLFLKRNFSWVFHFENLLWKIIQEVADLEENWVRIKDWERLFYQWKKIITFYDCHSLLERLFSSPLYQISLRVKRRNIFYAAKRKSISREKYKMRRGVKFQSRIGEIAPRYKKYHHRKLTYLKWEYLKMQIQNDNQRFLHDSLMNRPRSLKNESICKKEEEKLFFRRVFKEFAVKLTAQQILLFSSPHYQQYQQREYPWTEEERNQINELKKPGILAIGTPWEVKRRWNKLESLWGHQRHPLQEYDKIYPSLLKHYVSALRAFCQYEKGKYWQGESFKLPWKEEELTKMFIDQGKYVQVNQPSFIKQYLFMISSKLENDGLEMALLQDSRPNQAIYGLNSFRYDSEKEILIQIENNEKQTKIDSQTIMITAQQCLKLGELPFFPRQCAQTAMSFCDKTWLPRESTFFRICPICHYWISSRCICLTCGVTYHQECLEQPFQCIGCNYSIEKTMSWNILFNISVFKKNEFSLITPPPQHLLPIRKEKYDFTFVYEKGTRVNPSYNSLYFSIPTEEDQSQIAQYETYNFFPIKVQDIGSKQLLATRRIRKNEIVYIAEGELLSMTTFVREKKTRMFWEFEYEDTTLIPTLPFFRGPSTRYTYRLIPKYPLNQEIQEKHNEAERRIKTNVYPRFFLTEKGPRIVFLASRFIKQRDQMVFSNKLFAEENQLMNTGMKDLTESVTRGWKEPL